MKAKTLRGSATRPRDVFRDAERRAVTLRKLLKKIEQGKGRELRGVMDDAAKLAETIEHVARWGQTCPAVDVVNVEFQVEAFTSLLEGKVDQIFCVLMS
ncbi:hypothetical protein [Botrimarina mediterranea]|uniref:Uncharacterized protein n=1 Tax=Botrimarina mediterranea TaxID=2528022 RepID=A0A518K5G5_9BACT|nr:hypothetical protein [Botrimarina mediterranea]QDV73034.1 hypothetical protein Spa11_12210 [Botrimarina mediterranea]QDV77607.1 hypothetical protein K2D_12030 [Planctomycetes bacterium K2D]